MDPHRVPLREAAIDWMRAHGLFGDDGLGLSQDVFFAATRADKIARIAPFPLRLDSWTIWKRSCASRRSLTA